MIKAPYLLFTHDKEFPSEIRQALREEHIPYECEHKRIFTVDELWFNRMLNLSIAKKPKGFSEYRREHLPEFDEYTDEERKFYGYIIRTPKLLKFIGDMQGKDIYQSEWLSRDSRMVRVIEHLALEKTRSYKQHTGEWSPQVYAEYEVPAMRYSIHTTPLRDLKPSR